MIKLTTILLLLAVSNTIKADSAKEKAAEEVLNILAAIDPDIRPSPNDDPVTAKVQTYIRNIHIDDIDMKAVLDITFRMKWMDSRLAYKTKGVDSVTLTNPKLSWLPDAFFKNAMTSQYESVYPENYLRVHPDGSIIYSSRKSINLNCVMDLHRFPHDTQTCKMQIASYGYTTKDVIFEWNNESPIDIGSDLHLGRYSMEKYEHDYCTSETSTGDYSCVSVSFDIGRNFGAYLIEWYLPTMFLVVVAWFSFLIPFDQFIARLLLVLIPLIALASFAHSFTKGLTSVPYVKAIDIFTGFSLIFIFITLIHIIVCHVKGIKGEEPPVADSEEIKSDPENQPTALAQCLNKTRSRTEFLFRVLIVGFYLAFIFFYFVAYCGTG